RIRMLPASRDENPNAKNSWGADLSQRLKNNMLTYIFQLQFYADEKSTPIEDASVNWEESEIPYLTVAKLHLLKQDTDSPQGKEFSELAEKSVFDPWKALADHRPLGDVMRARKAVYYASQKERGAS
ncbi:MAG TPA: catalase, partial [Leptospiraceae bacterium]|nr:catalase [Leptospiraceae bacterium]